MEERLVQSERLATIGRFASQIAHEIRNPLSSITLNVELLEDEVGAAGDEARVLMRSVFKELDRLNDIVSEYLQRGHADNAIQELVENFKASSNIKIETQLMATSPEISLDERLLRQVLENLVRNGVEAIDGPGVMRIESDVVDRFFVIRVKDTGRGVPPEIQAGLSSRFSRRRRMHGPWTGNITTDHF